MKVVGKCGHTLATVNERTSWDVAVRGLLAVEFTYLRKINFRISWLSYRGQLHFLFSN